MLKPEPKTHKKTMCEINTPRGLLAVLEIGIRYHHGQYTPELAYFVSLNGRGKQYTGKRAQLNALACYNDTRAEIERLTNAQLVNRPA